MIEQLKARRSDRAGRMFRKPDFIIGDPENPYLKRWWLIPRNRFFNVYLHQILRSDDDRALHDHPWWNISIILKGGYFEHVPFWGDNEVLKLGGDATWRLWRGPRSVIFRGAKSAHRLELAIERYGRTDTVTFLKSGPPIFYKPCWSLFITGPRVRQWGFHCPKGWRHWRDFCGVPEGEEAKGGEIGPGCGGKVMAHIHADGTEEHRSRTPEEVAAIEEAHRIAQRSNVRSGEERRKLFVFYNTLDGIVYSENGEWKPCRRSGQDQRAALSIFEREMLFQENL